MLFLKIIGPIILLAIGLAQFSIDNIWPNKKEKTNKIIKLSLVLFMIIFAVISVGTIINDNNQTNSTIGYLQDLDKQSNEDALIAQEREALAIANRERIENRLIMLEKHFKPFISASSIKYPNQNVDNALENLLNELSEVKQSIKETNTKQVNSIRAILIEARLTCSLKAGEGLPPEEVDFHPIGDSYAYFEGINSIRIDFKSPVIFHHLDKNMVTVINNFILHSGSTLENQPIETLKNYKNLSVPFVTVIYGKSFDKFSLLEISIKINGKLYWYASWQYDQKFEVGPRFSIPLDEFHAKLN